ncbi:MAG: hypothetical protein IJT78_00070 [Oscillospiraceae bacterium]|nr:hypothetical protein [Oscillospiraceae bacterium]
MAKNSIYRPGDLQAQQEARRKAKGNPNKNIHHKKKNSNYGGFNAQAKKAADRQNADSRSKQLPIPRGAKIALLVLMGALAVLLVLNYTALKGNAVSANVASLLIGALCCYMAYVNYFLRKLRGGFHAVLTVILVILGAVYVLMSLAALGTLPG